MRRFYTLGLLIHCLQDANSLQAPPPRRGEVNDFACAKKCSLFVSVKVAITYEDKMNAYVPAHVRTVTRLSGC